MKRNIISGLIGAAIMFVFMIGSAYLYAHLTAEAPEAYEHVDFVSTITKDECFICGSGSDCTYWGEDNVGILYLNTFEMHRLEINRYDDQGQLIEELTGYMTNGGMYENDTYVNSHVFPDKGYASVEITSLDYEIDRDLVQSKLCQTCLDEINDLWFGDLPPVEFVFVGFEDRSIHGLVDTCPWFSLSNYGVDCEYEEDGDIDLLIHYIAPRYKER